MSFKRVSLLFAALTLTFSLAACGADNTPVSDSPYATGDIVDAESAVTSTDETVTSTEEKDEEAEVIEEKPEVPILRDSVMAETGAFVGCAITGSEVDDKKVWDIVTTHFNAVTLGNELKPDCTFGYSNGKVPGIETAELNGETIEVPKMDHSRADKILNKILKWNEENPDRQIKVRGHVLVWHSQTPEWFFHENYNKKEPYVDKATMDKRLEWYIKTMLTYYTGEDSKYKDLFYGWDVVNEAVSDGGGYRTEKENPSESLGKDTHGSNSSWYAVYQSNEFIINAFKYANKYAPASLELYYNDYNETNIQKQNTILELLQELKDKEGAPGEGTRISAMGMQGHYGMDSPSSNNVNAAMKAYCKIVGNVQITEWDISASDSYDGSEESVVEENEKLRKRYNMLYFDMKSAMKEDYVNLTGITFWGTVDHYSWLQSRSDVGGGNKTGLPQMPLLFDQNYEPKPCFYVFAK